MLGANVIPLLSKGETAFQKNIQKCIVVTKDATRFEQIQTIYKGKKCVQIDAVANIFHQIENKNHTEIIFDINFIDTKTIIQIFEKQHGYYKIMPKNSTFILGSDSSKNRGEVLMLPKN